MPAAAAGALAAVVAVAAGGAHLDAAEPAPIVVEPRIVEARVARIALDRIDLGLRIALRGSQAATIRSIAFTDAFVGRVPVWIEPVHGQWPLRPGQELLIPEALQVRVQARDALGADDFGAIVRTGSVPVRASVEVAIATPWLARLLFRPATETVVRQVAVDLPIGKPAGYLGPLARIGADIADVAQRGAAAWLASGLHPSSSRDAVASRFGGVVAAVTARYTIEAGGTPTPREHRASAVWWRPGVLCTTREALEPWRFDVGDATTLQLAGGRLQAGGRVVIDATRDHPGIVVDGAALAATLPSPAERKVYALVGSQARRLRLGDREAASNLACVRLAGADAPTPAAVAAPATAAERDAAAFAAGTPAGLVWTRIGGTAPGRLRLETPLHRASFGSPLVAGDRLIGVVASHTSAWPARLVDDAAARAPRLARAPAPASARAPTARTGLERSGRRFALR